MWELRFFCVRTAQRRLTIFFESRYNTHCRAQEWQLLHWKTENRKEEHDMEKPDIMQPLDWAKAACETMMRKFAPEDLPPKGHFHYHQGVFLSGMMETWKLCGDRRYFDYARAWIDSVFDEEGRMKDVSFGDLDDIQPGILLFPIRDTTGDPYYDRCIEHVVQEVRAIPRTPEGTWWHKTSRVNQMWLDGLYMGGPFMSEYAKRTGDRAMMADVIREALMMEKNTKDPATGLLRHAWDRDRVQPWADPKTGKSPECWGRAMGWVPIALLNDLDELDEDLEGRDEVIRMGCDLLRSLLKFQSPDGRWYQVVDKGDEAGNWLENSCSSLYAAGLAKAVRKGYLPRACAESAWRGFKGVVRSLTWDGDDLQIGNVCIGTGVGDYDFYIARPVSINDLHAVGSFLLMCTEMHRMMEADDESR